MDRGGGRLGVSATVECHRNWPRSMRQRCVGVPRWSGEGLLLLRG